METIDLLKQIYSLPFSLHEMLLLQYLVIFDSPECSYTGLEKSLKICKRSVIRAVHSLESQGILSVDRNNGKNRYTLNTDFFESQESVWEPPDENIEEPVEESETLEIIDQSGPEATDAQSLDLTCFDEDLIELDKKLRRGEHINQDFLKFLESRMLVYVLSLKTRKIVKGQGFNFDRLKQFDIFSLSKLLDLYNEYATEKKAREQRNEEIARSYVPISRRLL